MKAIRFVVLAALLAAFGSPAHAAEQTLEGTLVCGRMRFARPLAFGGASLWDEAHGRQT